ncbi:MULTISPECIES: MFS transporter [unclassified Streptomyces]|uniref:MFS transporter n=1 Tax=unclassified Streptomyces TaxID=2593676 RepID=UPI0025B35C6C|nr:MULTISPECIES: MFS transporter [unclassified Streptomyces]MDN3244906.1 MFS transporter [Streptomyces sp. ZSW22]MDN3254329.1 MFS transporter [Streptomyces sp. MA25(2023)]
MPALLALTVAYFAMVAAAVAIVGLGPLITDGLGVGSGAAGTLSTVYTVVFALGAPVAAVVLRRVDRKKVLLVGLVLMVLGGLGSAVAPHLPPMIAARTVQGVGAAVFAPTASVAAAMIVPPERRARMLSLVGSGAIAAMVLGAPLASAAGTLIGWRWTLAALAVLILVGMAMLTALLPPLPPKTVLRMRDFGSVMHLPGARPILWTTFLALIGQYVVYGSVAVYLPRRFGASDMMSLVILLAFGTVALCGNTLGAAAYNRFGGDRTLAGGVAGVALAFVCAALLPAHPASGIAAFALWGLFNPVFISPQQVRIIDLFAERSDLLIPLNTTCVYLGMSLGGMLGAGLLPAVGPQALSAVALVPLAAAAVAHGVSMRRRSPSRLLPPGVAADASTHG